MGAAGLGERQLLTIEPQNTIVLYAANSAIGLAVLDRLLACRKWQVVSTFRRSAKDVSNVYEKHGISSDKAPIHRVDLSSWDEVQSFVDHVSKEYRPWASISFSGDGTGGLITGVDADELWTDIEANLRPALNTLKANSQLFRNEESGRHIQISSVVAVHVVKGTAAYACAKSATESLVRSASREFAGRGITVNCLRLGYINAGMGVKSVPPRYLEAALSRTAVRKLGDASSIFSAIEWLLSPNNTFTNGAIIDIDGGFS